MANSTEVVPPTALSLIESLRQLETGFGEKIADMNKILHDTKGLSTSVATMKADMESNIKPKVATLMCQVTTLKEDIHKPQVGMDARVSELEKWRSSIPVAVADSTAVPTSSPVSMTTSQIQTKFDGMQSEIDRLKKQVNDQAVNLSIVAGWSDLLVKNNKSLQDQVSHNLSCHLQHELILGGVCQVNNESCKKAALEFFQKKVKVQVDMKDIWTAYRKGSATTKTIEGVHIKCPPQLVVRVAHHVRDKVMKNAKNLKGQVDPQDKFKFYVFPHAPESYHATKAKCKEFSEQTATENEERLPGHQKKVKINSTKCMVNGVLKTGLIEPPSPSKVINRMQLYGDQIAQIPLVQTAEDFFKGSKFIEYAVRARTLNTVDMVYVRLRALHPFAKHIMLAYNVAGERDSCDDGEWFGDLTMKKV